MRLKVTHLTVGIYHEVCFVCSSAEEAYFRKVMQALETEHALKSCLYVYDRDPLEGAIKRRLQHCYFVLFAITPSIIDRAVKDENDPFRRVYGYVDSVNQSAISLMSVGGTGYNNAAEYPKEMNSMYWLHRKQIRTGYFSPNLIAAELYAELRRHHQRRDKLYLEKQASNGVALYRNMYDTMRTWAGILTLLLFAGTGWLLYTLLASAGAQPWYWSVLNFVFSLAGTVGFVFPIALVFGSIRKRDTLLDVSTVFKDFKRLTVNRLCLYGTVVALVALFALLSEMSSAKQQLALLEAEIPGNVAQLAVYCAELLPLTVYYIKTVVFCAKLDKVTTDGAGFLRFASWRWKAHLIFGVLMAVGALLGTQVYRFFV